MTKSQNQTAVKQYLLSVIYGYEESLLNSSDEEKVKGLFDVFFSEYGFRVKQVGLQNALRDWLQGLTSVVPVEFKNHEIIELLKEWNLLDEKSTEAKEDKLLDQYWDMLAYGLIVLGNKYKAIK